MNNENHILLQRPERKNKDVTISQYKEWIKNKDIPNISDFIYERLYRRYIKPFEYDSIKYRKQFKNGFAILANCCLLIETLETFYRGWKNTNNRSEIAFLKYFSREKLLSEFSSDDFPTLFYKHIRCGILHQGEVTGGWRVSRAKETPLIDLKNKLINATKFQKTIKKSLINYRLALQSEKWDSNIWKNFRIKMDEIIKNCHS